jgi:hypothetical protein
MSSPFKKRRVINHRMRMRRRKKKRKRKTWERKNLTWKNCNRARMNRKKNPQMMTLLLQVRRRKICKPRGGRLLNLSPDIPS